MTATLCSPSEAPVLTGAEAQGSTDAIVVTVSTEPETHEDALEGGTTGGRLTGPELLAKIKQLGEIGKSELVRACGYVSTKKDGTERLEFKKFYEATLAAKGVEIGASSKGGKTGRKLSFTTKVQFNGNLMVGNAYTSLLDLQPGDEFVIKISKRSIILMPR